MNDLLLAIQNLHAKVADRYLSLVAAAQPKCGPCVVLDGSIDFCQLPAVSDGKERSPSHFQELPLAAF